MHNEHRRLMGFGKKKMIPGGNIRGNGTLAVLLPESLMKGFGMIACKMYASGTTSADAIATLNVPVNGKLVLCNAVVRVAGSATPGVLFQVSLQSTSQFASNDVRGILAEIGNTSDTTNLNDVNAVVPTPGIPVEAGQKIYLHRLVTGTVSTGIINLNLWIV